MSCTFNIFTCNVQSCSYLFLNHLCAAINRGKDCPMGRLLEYKLSIVVQMWPTIWTTDLLVVGRKCTHTWIEDHLFSWKFSYLLFTNLLILYNGVPFHTCMLSNSSTNSWDLTVLWMFQNCFLFNLNLHVAM